MNATEPAVLVGLLGVADRLDRLRAEHSAASHTPWVRGGLPIRATRARHSATNTGPISLTGCDTTAAHHRPSP